MGKVINPTPAKKDSEVMMRIEEWEANGFGQGVGKESESKGCFSVCYKGSTAKSVALEKIRPSALKAIVRS